MTPKSLVARLPVLSDDADPDLRAVVTALGDILRSMDELPPLYMVGGDVLVGNRPVASDARRGFFNLPTIDGEGPPSGTPILHGAGDPIVYTRGDHKLWVYDFKLGKWIEIPATEDDQEILEILFLIREELKLQRELGI